MRKILYGVLVSFFVGVLIHTSVAVAAPPDHAKGKAVGLYKSAENDGSGANTTGPYDPNGVGEPSGNGNGDGNATSKPCAGCVGNADSKNPPGQLPGPDDANNGYECDANSGIARGNPAHSFCSTSTTSTTIPEPTTSTTVPEATTSTTVPEATTSTTVPEATTSTTLLDALVITNPNPTKVKGITVTRSKLPLTGGDVTLLVGLGSGLAIAGAAFTKLARFNKIPGRK
ncbi:hypothetical protein EXS53_02320 [Patescibacteria group bacterium]|nr:hypothetical protein [Patescibacteria group bacterium]